MKQFYNFIRIINICNFFFKFFFQNYNSMYADFFSIFF
jgi:hypothetical protein